MIDTLNWIAFIVSILALVISLGSVAIARHNYLRAKRSYEESTAKVAEARRDAYRTTGLPWPNGPWTP